MLKIRKLRNFVWCEAKNLKIFSFRKWLSAGVNPPLPGLTTVRTLKMRTLNMVNSGGHPPACHLIGASTHAILDLCTGECVLFLFVLLPKLNASLPGIVVFFESDFGAPGFSTPSADSDFRVSVFRLRLPN